MQTSSMENWCSHIASLASSDLNNIPNLDTTCMRCFPGHPSCPYPIWRCLHCEGVFCGLIVGSHMYQHHKESKHSLVISCSKNDPVVFCYFCKTNVEAHQVIQQLQAFSNAKSSSSKLDKLDAMMVDVSNLISKPFPSFGCHQPDAKVGQDEFSLAKEGLQKIFDRGLEALADHKVQKEFYTYAIMLLSADLCPWQLKASLVSFNENLQDEMSYLVQAQKKLKAVSDLSASVTLNKFVLRQQSSKYTEMKKERISSEEKIVKLKARIRELEASLTQEELRKAMIDEVLDSIETEVTTAKDGLISNLEQVSAIKGTATEGEKILSAWNTLRNTFSKFA